MDSATKLGRMQNFKIMTYNIHSGIGRDKRYQLDRIIRIIAEEDPDIVALQEVDKNLPRSNFDDQSKIIAEALDMHYHHCVNRYIGKGEYGITTLSRVPLKNPKRHELTFRRRLEPRGGLRTDLALNGSSLHIFNVHLGLRTRERQHQRRRLLSESILLDKSLEDPVIVLGDFNDRPIPVVHEKLRSHFIDTFNLMGRDPRATFRWGPLKFRLDHIYISPHLHPREAYVVKTPLTRIASDHLPVVAIICPNGR